MSKDVKVLDCTLRDGGYINNWDFGVDAIEDIILQLESSRVDIIEIGFLKNEEYKIDRTVYNSIKQISKQIYPKKKHCLYAAMIEVHNPIPLEMVEPCSDSTVDIIRVVVWKRLLKEGFEYCKGIVEKGYKLCIQPARVDQYSYEEFKEMVEMFNELDPMAVYIVDSWGTQYDKAIMKYVSIAEKYLRPQIAIGYHGHNNLMQAFATAVTLGNHDTDREIIIDASIYGIGRGAGNLNTELFAKYLNEMFEKKYELIPLVEIFDKYIQPLRMKFSWGYSFPFFLSAKHGCNPDYASYYEEKGISSKDIDGIFSIITSDDKIIYTKEKAEKYLKIYKTNII